MKKKHYIIITPFFPTSESFVGPFIYDQAKAIAKESDYDVSVIKVVYSGDTAVYVYQGIHIHPIQLADLPSFLFPGLFLKKNKNQVLNKLKEITNGDLDSIEFIHGHVTYASGILAVAIANEIGAQSIVQHHGLDVMSYTNGRFQNSLLKKINSYWINKIHLPLLNKADWNVGVSQKTIQQLHEIKGYKPSQEYVLYNGVDTKKFYKIQGIKDPKIFTVGCIGNFWKTKDQLTLIKAFHHFIHKHGITNATLQLIGKGSTLVSCKSYVNKNSLQKNIQFLDTVDHADLNIFYNTLDVFVLPSYDEAFGCVYTEAYACGVPFIGVSGQGIDEMVLPTNRSKQLIANSATDQLEKLLFRYYSHSYQLEPLAHEYKIDLLIQEFLKQIQLREIDKSKI
jgi:glycosyltransferase involved in cell wall biosynthesis